MIAIGKVISLTNTATEQGIDGEQWSLYLNNNIFAGDKIITEAADSVEILLTNTNRIILKSGQSWTPTLETFCNSSDFSHTDATVPGFCKGDANFSEQLLQLVLIDKVTSSKHIAMGHAKATAFNSQNRFTVKRTR